MKHYIREVYVVEMENPCDPKNRAWLETHHFIKDSSEYQVMIGAPEYEQDYETRVEAILESARKAECTVSFLNIIVLACEKKASYLRVIVI